MVSYIKNILWMRRGAHDQALIRLTVGATALLLFTLLWLVRPSSPRIDAAWLLSLVYTGCAVSLLLVGRRKAPPWGLELLIDTLYTVLLVLLFTDYALPVSAALIVLLLGHGVLHGRKALVLFSLYAGLTLPVLEYLSPVTVDRAGVIAVAALAGLFGLLTWYLRSSGSAPSPESVSRQRTGHVSLKRCHMVLLGNSRAIRACRTLARREGARIKHVIRLDESGLEFTALLQRYGKYHLVIYDGSVCPETGGCIPGLSLVNQRPVIIRIAAQCSAERDAHLYIPVDSSADSVLNVLRRAYVLSNNEGMRPGDDFDSPSEHDTGSADAVVSDMVFDLNFVNRLRRIDSSSAYISEILLHSLADIENQLGRLQKITEPLDYAELGSIVHRAAATASLIGAHRLGRALKNFLKIYKTENSVKEIGHKNKEDKTGRAAVRPGQHAMFETLLVEYQRLYSKVTDYLNHEIYRS